MIAGHERKGKKGEVEERVTDHMTSKVNTTQSDLQKLEEKVDSDDKRFKDLEQKIQQEVMDFLSGANGSIYIEKVMKNASSEIIGIKTSQQKIAENITTNAKLITKLQNRIDEIEKDTMEKTQSLVNAKNDMTNLGDTQNKELTEKDSRKTSNLGKILIDHSCKIGNMLHIIWTVGVDNCIHTFDDYIW